MKRREFITGVAKVAPSVRAAPPPRGQALRLAPRTHQSRHKLLPIRIVFGGAWPTKCTTSISASVPVRGVKVVSPHHPDDQRATIYYMIALLAHVWTNCTGADRALARPERSDMP
jgi:hypothetical protein